MEPIFIAVVELIKDPFSKLLENGTKLARIAITYDFGTEKIKANLIATGSTAESASLLKQGDRVLVRCGPPRHFVVNQKGSEPFSGMEMTLRDLVEVHGQEKSVDPKSDKGVVSAPRSLSDFDPLGEIG